MRRTGRSGRVAKVLITVTTAVLITVLAGCGMPLPVRLPSGTDPSAAPTGPRVLLDEAFESGALDQSVWNTCHWWADNGCTIASNEELEWYLPEQARVRDGMLQLTAERAETMGSDGKTYPFRSGMVTTGPQRHDGSAKLSFTYGTVEARLRVPAGQGLWSAMWLLPADEESRPEIDVLEILGDRPQDLIMHLHPRDREADSPDHTFTTSGPTFAEGWHDIALDWSPGQLDFRVDGKRVWQLTGDQVPDEPMYVIFNLAVGGVYPGEPDETTEFPAVYAIDHVKITAAD